MHLHKFQITGSAMLCRYQFDQLQSLPGTLGLLHNRKCLGAGSINDDVPGARHLHQHKEC